MLPYERKVFPNMLYFYILILFIIITRSDKVSKDSLKKPTMMPFNCKEDSPSECVYMCIYKIACALSAELKLTTLLTPLWAGAWQNVTKVAKSCLPRGLMYF